MNLGSKCGGRALIILINGITVKYTLSILLFCFTSVLLQAQTDTIATAKLFSFVKNVGAFNRLYPQEKVYLHFDNTGYYLGETIWYKAYAVNASDNTPKTVSRVLYVELLNSRGIVLETKKLEIVNGQCPGDFYLSTFNYDYHPGYYQVRAYTKNMLNFGEETVFSRVFPVFKELEKAGEYTATNLKEGSDVSRLNLPRERKKAPKQKKVNIDFYPEGGNLVDGLNSQVAFKATDENGLEIDVTGAVVNDKNETVSEFSSIHNGMGIFSYTPNGAKNKVQISYSGNTYRFDLPKSLPNGYTMQVNALSANHLILEVEKSSQIPSETLGLSIMCRGRMMYFATIRPDSSVVMLSIPKNKLPAGVNQITLFDAKGEIHAERLVFIPPTQTDTSTIQAKSNKKSYKFQQRVNIDLKSIPGATFSLSVRDAANTPSVSDAGNILTNLLLSSDLKGCIENPSYYFASADRAHRKALDLLLMVQGWCRYEWKQMAGIQPFTRNYEPEKKLMVCGHIAGKSKEMKEVKLEIALDNDFLIGTSAIDSTGHFSTAIDTALTGNHYMLLSAAGLKKADRDIRLDRWFSPMPRAYSKYETTRSIEVESEDTAYVEEKDSLKPAPIANIIEKADSLGGYHEIKEVTVGGKRGKDLIYNVERDREKAVDLGEYYSVDAWDYLLEKDNGYYFRSDDDRYPDNSKGHSGGCMWGNYGFILRSMINDREWKYIWEDNRYLGLSGTKNIFVDLEQIKKIVVREGEKASSPSIPYIPGYLYPYDNTVYSLMRKDPNFRVTTFEGHSAVKDFYTGRPERENYMPTKTEHSRTLYWNPDVSTDSDGKAKISFYNNAFCREMEISAEGVTKEGVIMTSKAKE